MVGCKLWVDCSPLQNNKECMGLNVYMGLTPIAKQEVLTQSGYNIVWALTNMCVYIT